MAKVEATKIKFKNANRWIDLTEHLIDYDITETPLLLEGIPEGMKFFVGSEEITVRFDAGELERFFAKPKFTLKNIWRRFAYWVKAKG